jgi:hypothetical protein
MFISPREPGWTSYNTPRHWVLTSVAFYDTHELRWGYSLLPATTRDRKVIKRSKLTVPLFSCSLRQTVCSTFSRSGWSVVRSASLAKGGTSKKRLPPNLYKVPIQSNKVNPRTLQTAFVHVRLIIAFILFPVPLY